MKDVIVFGAGKLGKSLIQVLRQNIDVSVIGVADNSSKRPIENCAIIDINDKRYIDKTVIIAIAKPQSAVDVYMQLKGIGYREIFWYFPDKSGILTEEFGNIPLIDCKSWGDCVLPQVEMHIMDACNLNCRGCTHFSPAFSRQMPDFDSRMSDIKELKRIFTHVAVFYILGGEPLMNPQIKDYVCEIKSLLPETSIILVTNGLLLTSIGEDILKCFRDNNVIVSISEYEPTHRMIDRIKSRLGEFGVVYQIRAYDSKQKFNKPLSLKADSIHKLKCISDGCVNIYEGKIARCPTLMYIEHFNEVFHTSLPDEGVIRLEAVQNGRELLDELKQSVPLCKHCIEYEIPWSSCGKEITVHDFAVDE